MFGRTANHIARKVEEKYGSRDSIDIPMLSTQLTIIRGQDLAIKDSNGFSGSAK
jgi:hypothetical protein